MRLIFIVWLLSALPVLPLSAQQEGPAICVRNDSTETYLFAVEVAKQPGTRRLAQIAPGEMLCTDAGRRDARGTVSVFENRNVLEGCSRLVTAGELESLIAYSDFDRCHWGSHQQ